MSYLLDGILFYIALVFILTNVIYPIQKKLHFLNIGNFDYNHIETAMAISFIWMLACYPVKIFFWGFWL